MLRRSGFQGVVDRQLALFAEDDRELLEEAALADQAWTDAPRDEAEERYGDYQLVVDAIGERLADIRDHYASTLDEASADRYRRAFDRAASKRFRRFAASLEDS